MKVAKFFLWSAVVVLTLCGLSIAQANATPVDFRCAGADTFATGLNDAGQVVGWYGEFSSATAFVKQKNGSCEALPTFTGVTGMAALGINDPGKIVGIAFTDESPNGTGFLYEKGVSVELKYPDANTCQTFAFSINNRGQIVGLYDLWKDAAKTKCDGPDKPFLREADGTWTTISTPTDWKDSAQLNGINARGTTVGNYLTETCVGNSCKEFGFVRSTDGSFWTFSVPDAFDTMPTGVNALGEVVGRFFYQEELGPIGECHGFYIEAKGTTPVEIAYPDATFTCVGGINAPGEVSGAYLNGSGWHGFVIELKKMLP